MKGLSKLKWGQARRLHYKKWQWLRAKKISATMKKKFQQYTRPRVKGKFAKGTFKPKPKNIAYMVVGGFDYKKSKYIGKHLSLEVNIRVVKPKSFDIENFIKETHNYIWFWFVNNFNGLDITKLGFDMGIDEQIQTDEQEEVSLDYLEFNRPNWEEELKKDLENFLSDYD